MQHAPCERCGVTCSVGEKPEQGDVWPLIVMTPAQAPHGLCSCCAAHWWLYSVDGIRWALEMGRDFLERADVQAALSRVMAHMHPEFATLDWGRVIEQWALPWPPDWAPMREVQ